MPVITKQDTQSNLKENIIEGVVPPHMKERYICRFKTAEAGNSNKGHFMITFKAEIVKPTVFLAPDGRQYALGSLEVTYYGMVTIFDEDGKEDLKKSSEARDLLLDLNDKLGLPVEIDTENPNTKQYEGVLFEAIIGSKEKFVKKQEKNPVTGKMEYVIVKDAKGKPISQGWELEANIKNKYSDCNILGRSDEVVESNRAF